MIHSREDYNDITKLDKKIPKDEPVFLIRGQDEFCSAMVSDYINMRRNKYGPNDKVAKKLEPFILVINAWPKKHKADL